VTVTEDFKAKWTAALRSGRYQQGRQRLRDCADHYCCLGVAADLLGCRWTKQHTDSPNYLADFGPDGVGYALLPLATTASLGLTEGAQNTLVNLNDHGSDFDTIAAYIDANL
jgi:hypothetical protein